MTDILLDEHLLGAMKIPRLVRLTCWDAALQQHKRHASFRVQQRPYTLEYGFTCSCSGTEHEWRIDIGSLKLQVPAARDSIIRLFRQHATRGQKAYRRQANRANTRARALLHRYLTRQQRQELRATGAFTMRGRDGRQYTLHMGDHIHVEHQGQPYGLCVVPKTAMPALDVMLAQKVLLETDPEHLLRLAHATNRVTNQHFMSAGFICGDDPLPEQQTSRPLVQLTDQQIENPSEWVVERVETRDG